MVMPGVGWLKMLRKIYLKGLFGATVWCDKLFTLLFSTSYFLRIVPKEMTVEICIFVFKMHTHVGAILK